MGTQLDLSPCSRNMSSMGTPSPKICGVYYCGCLVSKVNVMSRSLHNTYRVTRMVAEKIMLTSNSKFRHRPGLQAKLTVKRNFKFGVNISYSVTILVIL